MNYNVEDIDWSSDEEDNVQEVPLKATKENYHNMVKSLGNERWGELIKYIFDDIRSWTTPHFENELYHSEDIQMFFTIDKGNIVINMSGTLKKRSKEFIKKEAKKSNAKISSKKTPFTKKKLEDLISEGLWKDSNEGEFLIDGVSAIRFDNEKSQFKLSLVKLKN